MNNLKILGKPIIPLELVGQNATLANSVYNDAFLTEINRLYPLSESMGIRTAEIAGNSRGVLERITTGSPVRNGEGEMVLGFILRASARAGVWQPDINSPEELKQLGYQDARECLEGMKREPVKTCNACEGYLDGVQKARKGGFVLPIAHQGRTIVLPSQKCVEYFTQRLRQST